MAENKNPSSKRILRIGIILSVAWMALGLLALKPADIDGLSSLQLLMASIAFLMPIILIWIAVGIGAAVVSMREEATEMRRSMDKMRRALGAEDGPAGTDRTRGIQNQLEKIAEMTQANDRRLSDIAEKTLESLGHTSPAREIAALAMEDDEMLSDTSQPALPMNGLSSPQRHRISVADFIRALNFPQNAEDKEGFRVLRVALEDHKLGGLIDNSKEILTCLAEDGIYMDDLKPKLPAGQAWRSFARGERGSAVASLAAISDRTVLSLTKGRLKNDLQFRDLSHQFIRRFDTVLQEFERTADNTELQQMGDSRTGRAFMILGKINGAFA